MWSAGGYEKERSIVRHPTKTKYQGLSGDNLHFTDVRTRFRCRHSSKRRYNICSVYKLSRPDSNDMLSHLLRSSYRDS